MGHCRYCNAAAIVVVQFQDDEITRAEAVAQLCELERKCHANRKRVRVGKSLLLGLVTLGGSWIVGE